MQVDLTVRGPDGVSRDIRVRSPDATPLACLLPLLDESDGADNADDPAKPVWSDGRRLAADARLGERGLRHGSELAWTGSPSVAPEPHRAMVRLHVVGGCDAGVACALDGSTVRIGRSPQCEVRLRDPQVSRLHALVSVGAGGVVVRDAGSTSGTSVDDRPVTADRAVTLGPGQVLRAGDAFVGLAEPPGDTASVRPGQGGALLVSPAPRSPQPIDPDAIGVPESAARDRRSRVPWLAALAPAIVGGGLAVLLHSPMFLLFAVLSPVTMLATALGDRLRTRREGRQGRLQRYRERHAAQVQIAAGLAAESRARRLAQPDPAGLLDIASAPSGRLWERRRGDPDLLAVRLGLAERPAQLQVKQGGQTHPAGCLSAVPHGVDLAAGSLGLAAPAEVARPVGRWIVAQLATLVSPADLEIAVLVDATTAAAWHWMRWLPHVRDRIGVDQASRITVAAALGQLVEERAATSGGDPGRRVLVVIDPAGAIGRLPGLASTLRRGAMVGVTALVLADRAGHLPDACNRTAVTAGEFGTRLQVNQPATPGVEVVADQVSDGWAERVARALAPLVDAAADPAASLPAQARLLDLLDLDRPTPADLRDRWAANDGRASTPIGLAPDATVEVDLDRDGPHALIAGTTGAGKSELLQSLVAGLAATCSPVDLSFVLVDFKGGAAFADCARLPHTAGLVTDLDAHLAGRALVALDSELRRREAVLARAGAADLADYRRRRPAQPLARLVIVVDEFAALADELPDFVRGLVGVAQRGRSLGLHLVLATQRPSGVVSPEIRANTGLRIALRVATAADSTDVVDGPQAAAIDRDRPGRAVLRRGTATMVFQAARVAGPAPPAGAESITAVELDDWRRPVVIDGAPELEPGGTDLNRLVDAARAAAQLAGLPAVHRPWLPVLPTSIATTELAPEARRELVPIGRVDRPAEQQQPVRYEDLATGGALLLTGGPGSGRTTALGSLAVAAGARLDPDDLHLYVLDFGGGGLSPLAGLPHCGSALTAADGVRPVARLLERLEVEVNHRHTLLAEWRVASVATARADGRRLPLLLVIVDGWEALANTLDEYDAGRSVERLLGLLRAAAAVGCTVALAGDRGTLTPRLLAVASRRLVLRLNDRNDYAAAGIRAASLPSALPPGRALSGDDGAEIQLAHTGTAATRAAFEAAVAERAGRWVGFGPRRHPPIRVRPLPAQVRLGDLPLAPGRILLGLGNDAAEPIDFGQSPARHLLVAGPPRSGRSTLLRTVLTQAADSRPVVVAAPPPSPVTAAARARGITVLSPDTEGAGHVPYGEGTLLLVDDSEAFLDTPAGDTLTRWLTGSDPPAAVVAGRSDELAVTYRGVAALVRRAHRGVLLCPGPGDGDLLGVRLARTRSADPPGRGLLIGERSEPIPVQVAQP